MLSWIHIQSIRDYKKTTQAVILCIVVVFLFSLAPDVFAQGDDVLGVEALEETNLALARTDFITIVARVINVILGLLGIIVVGYFIYAGYLIMTSGGEEDKIAKGKKTMINATIGLAIVLSSWGIATFIIRALSDATGTGSVPRTAGVRGPSLESFYISGALGSSIDDHYPERNQQDVVRNTSILITFAEPMDPSTVIRNTNNSCWSNGAASTDGCVTDEQGNIADPYYGDCQEIEGVQVCDTLIAQSINISVVSETEDGEEGEGGAPLVAAAMAVPQDGDLRNYYTFSIKPQRYLEASEEYLVQVVGGDMVDDEFGVRKKKTEGNIEGEDPFANSYRGFYSWNFTTGDGLDFTPPTVERVSPAELGGDGQPLTIPKNRIISVTFNEPMDPTLVQGLNGPDTSFHHILVKTTEPVIGEWKISNGYKTIEFFPTDPCGQNSCGETMYCLPADDDLLGYDVLLRTAHANLGSVVPWDSVYGTGVADLAGNLLDGNKDDAEEASVRERNIPAEPRNEITPEQKQPDNYYWNFFVADRVDREPPSIREISPEIDGGNVEAGDLSITFNTDVLARSISEIDLLVQDGIFEEEGYNPGESARIISQEDSVTSVRIRPASDLKKPDLGDDQSIYYFLATPHTVQNTNQQCFYPGLGPKLSGEATTVCTPSFDEEGLLVNSDNCGVTQGYNADTDTGCPYEGVGVHTTVNTDACLVTFENDINDRNP